MPPTSTTPVEFPARLFSFWSLDSSSLPALLTVSPLEAASVVLSAAPSATLAPSMVVAPV